MTTDESLFKNKMAVTTVFIFTRLPVETKKENMSEKLCLLSLMKLTRQIARL